MRNILVISLFLLILAVLAFAVLPGKQGAALRAEIAGRYSEGGIGKLLNGLTDAALLEISHKRLIELADLAERQIAGEIATPERIKSGQIRLGATKPEKPRKPSSDVDSHEKIEKIKPKPPLSVATSAPQSAPAAIPPPAVAPPGTEEAFSGLIKHEPRAPVPESYPFWTEERKREALENGEPGANRRACLFFCKKSN